MSGRCRDRTALARSGSLTTGPTGLGLIEEDATALGCTREIAHIDTVLERGTSAHRQLAVYRRGIDEGRTRLESLRAVIDWLICVGTPTVA